MVVIEAEGQWQLAESEPRVDLSIGRKIIENQKGSYEFRGSVGLRDSGDSQNLSLAYISLWGGRSLKDETDMKDFGVQWGWGTVATRRI